MNRVHELSVFVRIVEEGGISPAARKLGLSKSAVSRQLTALEKRLGAQLVLRTTRRFSLTDRGRTFYERVRRSLGELAEAEAEASVASLDVSGRLSIAAPLSFGRIHLAPAVHAFMNQHRGVRIDLDLSDRQVDIVASGFDLAVRIARLPDSTLIARRLCPIDVLIAASPAYWRRRGRPRTPADLAFHDCLHQSGSREQPAWTWTDESGKSGTVRFDPRLSANDGEVLMRAAIAGHGVVCEPAFILYEALAAGELEAVLTRWRWSEVSLNVVYSPSRHVPRKVRVLVDFLVGWFSRPLPWEARRGVMGS